MAKVKYTQHDSNLEDAISLAFSDLEELQGEMSEWRDSLEEKLSHTEKYDRVSEAADVLDDAISYQPDSIDWPDIRVTYQQGKKASKKSPYPRWLRRDNATTILGAAADALQGHINNIEDGDPVDDMDDRITELEEVVSQLTDAADLANGVEFPGMYG